MEPAELSKIFAEQAECHRRMTAESTEVVLNIARAIADALKRGNKVLLFGNGGSAADAQHVAAELIGRFARERRALPAIALTTDSSILTAVGNDYGFDAIFARQVEALALPGDIVVGISTSGRSPNVLRALEVACQKGAHTIGFSGGDGGELPGCCDLCFIAPAVKTARIQELHIAVWHAVCDLVEDNLTH
jgi:D-sedoheptulose 7-phosphate isomerase